MRQLKAAGIEEEEDERGGRSSALAKELDVAVFSEVTDGSWFKPPNGWPAELQYTHLLLWDDVPPELHFFRHKISDPSAVRRRRRTTIKRVTLRKHPCCGSYGLYAGEDIPKGEELFDYTGHVRVVAGEEHDTNSSSYLLNLFTHEDSQTYIDVDANLAGNEARFLNDYHGTGSPPNAQFWPHFDPNSGEKRIAVKTIADVPCGAELLVDYGGRYFERDSDDDSQMHSSDEEFSLGSSAKKKARGRAGGRSGRGRQAKDD